MIIIQIIAILIITIIRIHDHDDNGDLSTKQARLEQTDEQKVVHTAKLI